MTIEHERTLGIAAGLAKTLGWEKTEMNMDRMDERHEEGRENFARMVRSVFYLKA